jgi:GT2 family glycosyltransferase
VHVPQMPDEGPTVALVIPTRNNWRILDRLIQSLKATTYKNYTLTIIDNMSDEAETVAYLNTLEHQVIRIANPGGKFSYAYINNRAVEQVDADLVLFLNDDTSVISPSWLSQMVGWARLPGVGAVGARLLFPDGRSAFWTIDAAQRSGIPSVWIIRETVASKRCFRELPAEIAAIAHACFGFPYRVIFESSSVRKGWAELNRLDNFDLIEDGPGPCKATQSTYAVILTNAAFSAVPPRALAEHC